MASSGGDNANEKKNASDAPHVRDDEGESRQFLGDSSMEYVGTIRKGIRKGVPFSLPDEMLIRITRGKIWPISFIKWDPSGSSSISISSSQIWSNS